MERQSELKEFLLNKIREEIAIDLYHLFGMFANFFANPIELKSLLDLMIEDNDIHLYKRKFYTLPSAEDVPDVSVRDLLSDFDIHVINLSLEKFIGRTTSALKRTQNRYGEFDYKPQRVKETETKYAEEIEAAKKIIKTLELQLI